MKCAHSLNWSGQLRMVSVEVSPDTVTARRPLNGGIGFAMHPEAVSS